MIELEQKWENIEKSEECIQACMGNLIYEAALIKNIANELLRALEAVTEHYVERARRNAPEDQDPEEEECVRRARSAVVAARKGIMASVIKDRESAPQ